MDNFRAILNKSSSDEFYELCSDGFNKDEETAILSLQRGLVLLRLKNCDICKLDEVDRTALMKLFQRGFNTPCTIKYSTELAMAILKHEDCQLDKMSYYFWTPLMYLFYHGFRKGETAIYAKKIALAILQRVDCYLKARNQYRDTPLIILCYRGFKNGEAAVHTKELILTILRRDDCHLKARNGYEDPYKNPTLGTRIKCSHTRSKLLGGDVRYGRFKNGAYRTAFIEIIDNGFKDKEVAKHAIEVIMAMLEHDDCPLNSPTGHGIYPLWFFLKYIGMTNSIGYVMKAMLTIIQSDKFNPNIRSGGMNTITMMGMLMRRPSAVWYVYEIISTIVQLFTFDHKILLSRSKDRPKMDCISCLIMNGFRSLECAKVSKELLCMLVEYIPIDGLRSLSEDIFIYIDNRSKGFILNDLHRKIKFTVDSCNDEEWNEVKILLSKCRGLINNKLC